MTDQTPTSHDADPDWIAIARFLAGESSPGESATVRAWLGGHPLDARAVAAVRTAGRQLATQAAVTVDVEAALARVHERMYQPVEAAVPPSQHAGVPAHAVRAKAFAQPLRTRPRVWAAAGLLAAGILLAVLVARRSLMSTAPATADRTFATGVGERDSVRLGDGTTILLAAGGRLVVPGGYGNGARTVRLEGLARFDVVHDAAHPFRVQVGGTTITDIGTVFTVRNDAAGVTVAVTSGAAQVSSPRSPAVTVAAGDAASVDSAGNVALRGGGASAEDFAWADGALVFRAAGMPRVQEELRRWYGVQLVMADSAVARQHLTATFTNDARPAVLNVIALSLGANVQLRGDTAVLRSLKPPR